MNARDRLVFAALLVDAVLLAVAELLFLPLYIGATPFPITAAVAAFTTPLLVAAAAKLSTRRVVAAAPLIVWFVTLVVFGVGGPGGDIVLPGVGWRTLLLVGAGVVPSSIMLGIVLGRNDARKPAPAAH